MCIPSSRGPRDKVKSSQVNPKVILVQYGVVVVVGGDRGGGGGGGVHRGVPEARLTMQLQCIYFKVATTKTILILVNLRCGGDMGLSAERGILKRLI